MCFDSTKSIFIKVILLLPFFFSLQDYHSNLVVIFFIFRVTREISSVLNRIVNGDFLQRVYLQGTSGDHESSVVEETLTLF